MSGTDWGADYCDCYGTDGPLCDLCEADERELDDQRQADLFLEDVFLYAVPLGPNSA